MDERKASIYEYLDYRRFLADAFELRAARDPSFTKAAICKKLGLPNSRSYFGDILSGQKNLSNIKMELLIEAFGLQENEAQYFRFLVQYNQTEIRSEKDFYFRQLTSLNKTPRRFVTPQLYAYYKDWHHSVIRATLDVVDFTDDWQLLVEKIFPRITEAKARASIELLSELGLIYQNEQGFWKPSDRIIQSQSGSHADLIRKYHAECLDIAKKTLTSNSRKRRQFSTKTLSLSGTAVQSIEKRLQQFKEEISSIVHKDTNPADTVYQLNIQFFPHSL